MVPRLLPILKKKRLEITDYETIVNEAASSAARSQTQEKWVMDDNVSAALIPLIRRDKFSPIQQQEILDIVEEITQEAINVQSAIADVNNAFIYNYIEHKM